jgi:hypothetical protein
MWRCVVLSRWWRQCAPLKLLYTLRLHGTLSQKAPVFILATVRTWNLTCFEVRLPSGCKLYVHWKSPPHCGTFDPVAILTSIMNCTLIYFFQLQMWPCKLILVQTDQWQWIQYPSGLSEIIKDKTCEHTYHYSKVKLARNKFLYLFLFKINMLVSTRVTSLSHENRFQCLETRWRVTGLIVYKWRLSLLGVK